MAARYAKAVPLVALSMDDVCQERVVHNEQVMEVQRHILSTEDASRVAALFAVLSDPTRLQVLQALLNAPDGELCVCDIARGLGRDDTTISHQLRVLRNQRVVTMRKVGRSVYYRLIDEHVRRLLQMGMEHACETGTSAATRIEEALA